MKKLWALVLALLLLLSLAACGAEKPGTEPAEKEPVKEETPAEPQKTEEKAEEKQENADTAGEFNITVNGVAVAMEAEAGPILEALGEYESVFDMESCAGLGTMRYYTYSGFELGTYEMEGRGELVYSLMFSNDLMETEEGIVLGSTPAEAKAAYEGEYVEDGSALKIDRGNCRLSIICDESAVTMIEYVSLDALGMSSED